MKFIGQYFEVEGLDEYAYCVDHAVVTAKRIALDWEDDGIPCLAVLHSTDGGYSYQGYYGPERPDTSLKIQAWRYRSVVGDTVLWIEWQNEAGGYSGSSIVHLVEEDDE